MRQQMATKEMIVIPDDDEESCAAVSKSPPPAAPVEPPPPARTPPRAPSTSPPPPSTRSPPRYPSTSPGTAKVVTVPVLRLEADGRQMSPRAANIRALGTAFNNSSMPCRASPQTAPGGSPTSSSRGHASVSDGTSQASQSTNLSTDEEGRGKRERRKD